MTIVFFDTETRLTGGQSPCELSLCKRDTTWEDVDL